MKSFDSKEALHGSAA